MRKSLFDGCNLPMLNASLVLLIYINHVLFFLFFEFSSVLLLLEVIIGL